MKPIPSIRVCKTCSVPKNISLFKQRSPTCWNWTCKACYYKKYSFRLNANRRKGTRITGEDNGMSKLTWDWVRFIRTPTGRQMRGTKLAEFLGVTPGALSHIRSGKTWKEER